DPKCNGVNTPLPKGLLKLRNFQVRVLPSTSLLYAISLLTSSVINSNAISNTPSIFKFNLFSEFTWTVPLLITSKFPTYVFTMIFFYNYAYRQSVKKVHKLLSN